ncbi:MAG: type II secretion system protein [Clostridia bacterium]|nr:type II secretion system protein [Clostridia bacterium]
MKKEKGITLITLVVTITILIILASIATYSGISIVNSSKFTAFTTELKTMQAKINSIYEEDKTMEIGDNITGSTEEQANKVFAELAQDPTTGITDKTGYRFWSKETIKQLGIDGIEHDFFVNLQKRSVISYEGLNYEGKVYYTLSQIPNSSYNVEYEENQEKPTFDTKLEKVANNKWRINIINIQYNGYINKWQVKYRVKDTNYWNTTEETSFIVTEKEDYEICIQNGNVISELKVVEINAKVGKIVTDINKEYTNNGTAIIPVGFMIVPGLDNVEEGLVISDSMEDTEDNANAKVAKGNQFVWIPVLDETKYEKNKTYESVDMSAKAIDDTNYLPDGIINEESLVRSAKGFYMSRYEAGKEGTGTLVSKKRANIWTNILQVNAKSTAKEFINNENVKSALISGIQWDMTMAFISSKPRVDGTNKTYNVTKSDSSRHVGSSVTIAGNNEADKVCNIYDLEGNAWEYVAEKSTYNTSYPFVRRGGTYDGTGSASYRFNDSGNADKDHSFRLVLYVM